MLIRLLLERGGTVAADRLVEAVWGLRPPASARNLLTVYVSQLRRTLGADAIETRPGGYGVVIDPADVDADRFTTLATEGMTARAAGNEGLAASRLRRALALWRGPALVDVAGAEFAAPEVRRLDELRLLCLEEQLAAELELGKGETIVPRARALTISEPYRERPRELLMQALYRADRHAEALAEYRGFRDLLSEELGLEPSAELRALEGAILRQEVAVRDSPARSTQFDPPALLPRTLLTPLIGRERELVALHDLVGRPGVRLVTIVGCGGSGKSSLAIEFARQAQDVFANGVAFVELASVTDPQLVIGTIAHALGLAERSDGHAVDTLRRWLSRRELLLVLDNLEQIVDCGADLVALLRHAPLLTIATTSRRVLELSGEHVFPLEPLLLDDAVTLFATRALARDPTVDVASLVTERGRGICRRLDCLPLAVELAAAQIPTLGIQGLEARLHERLAVLTGGPRDVPTRQQTLRDTLAWSSELLRPAEREAFARLGVFSGSYTFEAACAVTGGTPATMATLASHSLIRVGADDDDASRISMLETVREHALELLARFDAPKEAWRTHAAHYLGEVFRIEERAADTATRLRLIDREIANLRAALDWLEQDAEDEAALRLATDLYRYWYMRGFLREGRRRLSGPLDRGVGSPALRALALRALSGLNLLFGDLDGAEIRAEHGVAAARAAGLVGAEIGCETVLGLAALEREAIETARAHIERSLFLAQASGLVRDVAVAETNLAKIALEAGDLVDARVRLEGVLDWHESHSPPEDRLFALVELGLLALRDGRCADAEQRFEQTVALAGEAGFARFVGTANLGLAAVALERGDGDGAAHRLGWSAALFAELGEAPAEFDPALGPRTEAAVRSRLGEDGFAAAYEAGRTSYAGVRADLEPKPG